LLHIHLGLGAALSDLGLIDITEGTDVVACDALTNGIIWQALLAAVLESWGGHPISLTMSQVISATALGILFCTIRLQTNNLWPTIRSACALALLRSVGPSSVREFRRSVYQAPANRLVAGRLDASLRYSHYGCLGVSQLRATLKPTFVSHITCPTLADADERFPPRHEGPTGIGGNTYLSAERIS
jgi:hypothetical protein